MTVPAVSWGPLAGLIAFSVASLWWLTSHALKDRALRALLFSSYFARLLLGMGLFAISYYQWPILRSLQAGEGFWAFGLDSRAYHHLGSSIALAWAQGTELPRMETAVEFFAVTGAVYRLFGSHPLSVIVLNAWLGAMGGLLAYLIGRKLDNRRAGLVSAGLVGFWPSSILWSAQLMKDALSWCLLLLAIWLMVGLVQAWWGGQRLGRARGSAATILLGITLVALTRLRFYVGSSFALAALLVMLPASAALWRRSVRRSVAGAGLAVWIAGCVIVARALNVYALVSPSHPHLSHYRLAVASWEAGSLQQAGEEFQRAIHTGFEDAEAYLGWGGVEAQQQRWSAAIEAYKGALKHEAPEWRVSIRKIIARLYAEWAHDTLDRLGDVDRGVPLYEAAVEWDPQLWHAYAELGVGLARQQQFERAFEMIKRAEHLSSSEQGLRQAQARIHVEQGRVAFERGDVEAAFAAYHQAVVLDPTAWQIYADLGIRLSRHERFAQAVQMLQRAEELQPADSSRSSLRQTVVRTLIEQGRDAFKRERFSEAIVAYQTAMVLQRSAWVAYMELGVGLAQREQFADALDVFAMAFAQSPGEEDRRRLDRQLAEVYMERGRYAVKYHEVPAAVEAYQAAWRLRPEKEVMVELGWTFAGSDYLYQGLDILGEMAHQTDSDATREAAQCGLARLYVSIGMDHVRHGRNSIGFAVLEEALRLDPMLKEYITSRLAGVTSVPEALIAKPAALAAPATPATPATPAAPSPSTVQVWIAALSQGAPVVRPPTPAAHEAPAEFMSQAPGAAAADDVSAMAVALFSSAAQRSKNVRVNPALLSRKANALSFFGLGNQVQQSAYEITPEALQARRHGFVTTGGYSLMDAQARISTPKNLLTYLPRGLLIGVLAPFPWQWFDWKGSTGGMRLLAGGEMILLYFLLPIVVFGIRRIISERRLDGLFVAAVVLATLVPVSLVVANLGTLFRLRLLFMLPLLIIIAVGDPIERYRRLIAWVAGLPLPAAEPVGVSAVATQPAAVFQAEPARPPAPEISTAQARLVSVVIPAYNATRTLPVAIGSVLRQTYSEVEVIVVDDGSTDETPQCAERFGPRVRVIRQARQGPGAARNRGAQEALGAMVAFLDADDLWLPHKLARQVAVLQREPDIEAVQCSAYLVTDALQVIGERRCRPGRDTLLDALLFRNLPAVSSTLLVRREFFLAVGGFPADLEEEAWEMMCRLARFGTVRSLSEPLALYRQHAGNRSRRGMAMFRESGIRFLERLFADPSLDPAIRRQRSRIWARFYAMLAGGHWHRREWAAAWRWGRKALATSPSVAGYLLGLPARRLQRALARRRRSFAASGAPQEAVSTVEVG